MAISNISVDLPLFVLVDNKKNFMNKLDFFIAKTKIINIIYSNSAFHLSNLIFLIYPGEEEDLNSRNLHSLVYE